MPWRNVQEECDVKQKELLPFSNVNTNQSIPIPFRFSRPFLNCEKTARHKHGKSVLCSYAAARRRCLLPLCALGRTPQTNLFFESEAGARASPSWAIQIMCEQVITLLSHAWQVFSSSRSTTKKWQKQLETSFVGAKHLFLAQLCPKRDWHKNLTSNKLALKTMHTEKECRHYPCPTNHQPYLPPTLPTQHQRALLFNYYGSNYLCTILTPSKAASAEKSPTSNQAKPWRLWAHWPSTTLMYWFFIKSKI